MGGGGEGLGRQGGVSGEPPVHVVMVTVAGLAGLALFYFGARLMGREGQDGARVFIWAWLAAALLNAAVGVVHAGIPVVKELGAFVPIFGIPAAAAWYLAYKVRA